MPGGSDGLASAVRIAVRSVYVTAAVIWLAALAFAGYRFYQIRTLTPLEAEVLTSGVDSYTVATRDVDSDGFTIDSATQVSVAVARVRYTFAGRTWTVEARHDTGGLEWVQARIARRWKPGGRIRIHIDPDRPDKPIPDLGLNLATFQMSIVLALSGCFFVAIGYAVGRLPAFAAGMFERAVQPRAPEAARVVPWRNHPSEPSPAIAVDQPLPVPLGTATAIAGVVCCIASPLFDPLGYVLTFVGVVLVWKANTLSRRARLVATAIVLPPRIAPLVLSLLAGPGDFSFVLNPDSRATSTSAWGWYGLLCAICALLLLICTEKGNAFLAAAGLWNSGRPGTRPERSPALVIIPALVALGWANTAVLGLKNQFDWVEAAGAQAWDLRHAVRGAVATFKADGVASIDGREEGPKESPVYRVRFSLHNGPTLTMSTRSPGAFSEMKKLAATMELPPGRMRLTLASGETWTNGPFSLQARTGTYRAENGDLVELRLDQPGRLTGTESVHGGGGELVIRPLRAVKLAADGGIEYRTGFFTASAGRFGADELILNGIKYAKTGK